MAFIVVEIDTGSQVVTQANQELVGDSTKPFEGVIAIRTVLEALLAGAKNGQVTLVVRSSTSSPVASGGGISAVYNLK